MKAVFFANTDWYLYNFRLAYARFLKEQGWEVLFLSPSGEYVSRLKAEGFRHIALAFSRKGINPLSETQTIQKIKEIYEQEKPDLVHHFTIKCVIYGSIAAQQLGISGIVNSITGLGYIFLSNSPRGRVLRAIVTRLYKKALKGSQVVFENPDDRDLFLQKCLIDRENANIVLGTGIDIDRFVPIPAPDSVPLTILPARMIWDKGIGEFVEAAAHLREKGINARFALIGKTDDGNPSCIPYEQLTRWQKEGNVEWWGWQDDIQTVLSMCDIVCLPSYREGLPKVLIEAASCGRPIITTDVPGCRETVDEGINGFLVPAKDAGALEEALLKLVADKNLRQEMGNRSREKAVRCFSNEIVNDALFRIYQKALAAS